LQQKPASESQGDVTGDVAIASQGKNASDPFVPPYNVNLHVGDLKDEESQEEFGVLVRKVASLKCFTDFFDIPVEQILGCSPPFPPCDKRLIDMILTLLHRS
jgi:hypothetical protein